MAKRSFVELAASSTLSHSSSPSSITFAVAATGSKRRTAEQSGDSNEPMISTSVRANVFFVCFNLRSTHGTERMLACGGIYMSAKWKTSERVEGATVQGRFFFVSGVTDHQKRIMQARK